MKKCVSSTVYDHNSQEFKTNFLTNFGIFPKLKNSCLSNGSQSVFLFHEKLPIRYANIRV